MRIVIYTRPGCHLCDQAKTVLRQAGRRHEFELMEMNVELDPALESEFGQEIPVVFVDGRKTFKFHISADKLDRCLNRSNHKNR